MRIPLEDFTEVSLVIDDTKRSRKKALTFEPVSRLFLGKSGKILVRLMLLLMLMLLLLMLLLVLLLLILMLMLKIMILLMLMLMLMLILLMLNMLLLNQQC